jgi:exodeoxyribonuclease V beta subunit
MTTAFDLRLAVLDPGVTLLEASAGAGKTYTLAGLFFRLVTEHDLAPSQILVSTYTEAATAELRDRIRKLLRAGVLASATGESDDEFLRNWFADRRVPLETARERLLRAIRGFDEAAIHTIHGFCRRMLQDRAFESGLVFNAELITDQEPLLRELADDYWRAHFHAGEPAIAALALAEKMSAAGLARLLQDVVSHPLLHILPEGVSLDFTVAEIEGLFAELRSQWPKWQEEVACLLADGQWAKKAFIHLCATALRTAEHCIADPAAPCASYAALDTFTPARIQKDGVRAKKTAPEHAFFDRCGRLRDARRALKTGVETDFLDWARRELPRRKAQRNVITFDDLLTRFHGALYSPSGEALASVIRSRFRAALIDEFQDTDAIQEEIFRKLFRDGKCWLFLIGDPKQAIYGFRGADVFTYLAAAAGARRFHLGNNFRSTTQLVTAVNTIFSNGEKPFVIDEIAFDSVQAAGRSDAHALIRGDEPLIPFQIWAWQSEDLLSIKAANDLLPRVVAAEAARMLAGGIGRGERPLAPSDLAVLVVKNAEARLVQAALNAVGIPSVLLTDESVFQSAEARELHTLLAAIAEPAYEARLRAALSTEAFGFSADAIEALQRDDIAWEDWLLRFQRYHELWRNAGFIPMFRHLLQEENLRTKMLRFGDGERRLTNLLHLGELLHQAAAERRLGPNALLAWLAERRNSKMPAGGDHELRLERDEAALQIATVHKSKGLEYEVVFCPFSWNKAEPRKGQPVFFHEATAERRLALDLGSERLEENTRTATRERLAEHARLLYVAFTRARLQTHFIWGRFDKHAVSAANWVLHPLHTHDDLKTMSDNWKALSAETLRGELKALAERAPESITVIDLPSDAAPRYAPPETDRPTLAAREFHGRIARDWRVSSFSSLTLERDDERPDHDPQVFDPAPSEAAIEEKGIHAFPRGKKAGSCLHEMFEQIDFTQTEGAEDVVSWKLAVFGFSRTEWLAPVTACVRNTLTAELEPGFSLEKIDAASRLVELEFYLPVNQLTAQALLRTLGPDAATGLQFEPRRGMLKGFIDLVVMHEGRFFILDWKSNHLGPHAASYAPEALAAAMRQHHYGLQYSLYTLALHRYLSLRLPDYDYDTHFGGVFYIFLRGVDPAQPGSGILHARPPRESIEELSLSLSGGV